MRDKQFILGEIRRSASLNNNKPVGVQRFKTETGIAQHEWCGVHWARWSDALKEAGFEPLEWNQASDEEQTIGEIVVLVRKYGRLPIKAEILLEKKRNAKIITPSLMFKKYGGRSGVIRKIYDYCSSREEFADVSAVLELELAALAPTDGLAVTNGEASKPTASGYVYLVKSGKLYKIGCSENHWRRKGELHKQTAEGITEVHTISAIDDAPGIEKYWHERFADKRQHGEWFDLLPEDISAFKKRKFM